MQKSSSSTSKTSSGSSSKKHSSSSSSHKDSSKSSGDKIKDKEHTTTSSSKSSSSKSSSSKSTSSSSANKPQPSTPPLPTSKSKSSTTTTSSSSKHKEAKEHTKDNKESKSQKSHRSSSSKSAPKSSITSVVKPAPPPPPPPAPKPSKSSSSSSKKDSKTSSSSSKKSSKKSRSKSYNSSRSRSKSRSRSRSRSRSYSTRSSSRSYSRSRSRTSSRSSSGSASRSRGGYGSYGSSSKYPRPPPPYYAPRGFVPPPPPGHFSHHHPGAYQGKYPGPPPPHHYKYNKFYNKMKYLNGSGQFYAAPTRGYPPPPPRFPTAVPPGDEEAAAAAAAALEAEQKKMPNYRLIGRNIFDPGAKQHFFKIKKKTNTYYSRFIKQHPMSNLPLAFQKSVSLAEDKALEEVEKGAEKKSKKKKDVSSGDDDSELEFSDDEKKKNKDKKKKKKKKVKSGEESELKTSQSSSESGDEDFEDGKKMKYSMRKNGADDGDGSDASMMDLSENLKPIGEYIRNREQMLKEMLRCIKGPKLQSMLPEILKNKPFELIREKCMEELEVMSKKRIRCLLIGKDMTSSSGTDESTSDEDGTNTATANKSNTSSLNDSQTKPETDKSSKLKPVQSISKFKPIGAETSTSESTVKVVSIATKPITLLKSEEKYSLRSDDTEDYENASQDAAQSEQGGDAGDGSTKPQSGVEAAGFRKFVKKSINIRLKHTDSASNLLGDDSKAKEMKQMSATSVLNQDYRKYVSKLPKRGTLGDLMRTVASSEDVAVVNLQQNQQQMQHLSPYMLMSNQSAAVEEKKEVKSDVYDYNYDDDLSNLDSELEKENLVSDSISSYHSSDEEDLKRRKRRSKVSRATSSDEDRRKKRRRRSVSVSSFDSDEGEVSSGEERKRAKRRHRKEKERKKEKARRKRRHESSGDEAEASEDLHAVKDILRNILEMKIVEEENGDPEIKEILQSLLNTINEKELSVEDLDEIKETLARLFDVGGEEVKRNSDESDDEKRRKKKRKKSGDDERGKRRRHSRKEPSEEEGEISDDDGAKKLGDDESDRSLNGNGEEMEAGEIDDLYDDDDQIFASGQIAN